MTKAGMFIVWSLANMHVWPGTGCPGRKADRLDNRAGIALISSGLADPLPQAVGRGPESASLHLPCRCQCGFPGLHGAPGLQGRGRPFAMVGRCLGKCVAHETHHVPPASRLRRHRVGRQLRVRGRRIACPRETVSPAAGSIGTVLRASTVLSGGHGIGGIVP